MEFFQLTSNKYQYHNTMVLFVIFDVDQSFKNIFHGLAKFIDAIWYTTEKLHIMNEFQKD